MEPAERMQLIEAWCQAHSVGPEPICDMDYQRITLTDGQNRIYSEVATNLWATHHPSNRNVVYLGTGKHGSGIILRPLYVDYGEGWYNISTGKAAPAGMLSPADER